MSSYNFQNNEFVIKDFQNAKTFASFLPAIAGIDGKPLWAFYANVGQCLGGFGVNSKETPITPFDSANLAYQNIPIKSFRSFIKVNNKLYTPFFKKSKTQEMRFTNTYLTIKEDNNLFSYEISYTTVPHKNYAGLVRKVTIKNLSSKTETFSILDGLPIFFPHGLSNFCYKELVSLMSAYCEIINRNNNAPFVKFKTSTADQSEVSKTIDGNGFISLDSDNNKLTPIVDLEMVFSNDKSLLEPIRFKNLKDNEFLDYYQQEENKLPCAFSYTKKELKPNESYSFVSVYGMFDSLDIFLDVTRNTTYDELVSSFKENEELLDKLLKPLEIKTGNALYDLYAKQCFLDNNLRGGFPILINNKDVYYVFSRKHGDMERDYNSFEIPSKYYSSGCGNFRDVNQNRRSDLYFYPFVKEYNIDIFFSLIGLDGKNPLTVRPPKFVLNSNVNINETLKNVDSNVKKQITALLKKGFEPSELYTLLKDNKDLNDKQVNDYFNQILSYCNQEIRADFSEGYWIDHWTYNMDLLENYYAIYPDRINDLLNKEYPFFNSHVKIKPRSAKYVKTSTNVIRQYNSLEFPKSKVGTDWYKDSSNQILRLPLISKIIGLILVNFASLDSLQLGIEMECDKPGWNDAMNGLPGLFGSGVSETIELYRLIKFTLQLLNNYDKDTITLFAEQNQLLSKISNTLFAKEKNRIDSFTYWNRITTDKEFYRKQVYDGISGLKEEIPTIEIRLLLSRFLKLLKKSLKKLKDLSIDGIIPTYLYYEMTDYEIDNKEIRPKEFKLKQVPAFLEASARLLKLGKEFFNKSDYNAIKNSDLFDKNLKFYKTCASLDDANFEIGRVHAFTKGWLERECNFLHMTYKYLLGLLTAGYDKEFYKEIKTNLPCFMNPKIYGRNPLENSSFIVPSCNPDIKLHGQGFFARLTGANAEFMQILCYQFIGKQPFRMVDGNLSFVLEPTLSKELFDKNKQVSFRFLNSVDIVYHNDEMIDVYYRDGIKLSYEINKKKYDIIPTNIVNDIRDGKVKRIDVVVSK